MAIACNDDDDVPVRGESSKPSDGIFSLPVVGIAFSKARQFYAEMAPRETDPTEVRLVKEVLRWSSVVGWAAIGALVVLEPGHSARKPS